MSEETWLPVDGRDGVVYLEFDKDGVARVTRACLTMLLVRAGFAPKDTGAMMALPGFLLARIADDEAECYCAPPYGDCPHPPVPDRLLAECEAKRRIVEHCDFDHLALSPGDPYVLQLLALPYADHPDYDESWRP